MEDGWWAGIKMTAPEGINLTADNDVKYQSKVGDNAWSADKSLFNNQDTKDGETPWIGLWALVNEEKVAAAKEADGKITTQWRFDWDGDGFFEQTVVFEIDANTVTLNPQA